MANGVSASRSTRVRRDGLARTDIIPPAAADARSGAASALSVEPSPVGRLVAAMDGYDLAATHFETALSEALTGSDGAKVAALALVARSVKDLTATAQAEGRSDPARAAECL